MPLFQSLGLSFWAECMNFVKTYRTHNATLGYPKIICAGRVHRVPGREQNQKLRAHSWKGIEWNQANMTCSHSDAYLETKNKYFGWYLHADSLALNILNNFLHFTYIRSHESSSWMWSFFITNWFWVVFYFLPTSQKGGEGNHFSGFLCGWAVEWGALWNARRLWRPKVINREHWKTVAHKCHHPYLLSYEVLWRTDTHVCQPKE